MAAIATLDDALRDARLFRGGRSLAPAPTGLPSGFDALDAALPWGGLPRGALTELLVAHDGLGELTLLLPALRAIAAREPIAWVGPPYLPYAPALAAAGLPLERVRWVLPPPGRAAWAMEQCLRAGCLGAVLGWLEQADDRCLRRLQVAAEAGGGVALLFRPLRQAANPSPAALRLAVEAASPPPPAAPGTHAMASRPPRSPGPMRAAPAAASATLPPRPRLRVLKCRGAVAPAQPFALPRSH
jgi:cell division inhibitor SulA